MKYIFASDIHGSAFYCKKLLETFENLQAQRLVLLGDLLYHGPRNDLPKEYNPKEVAKLLNNIKEKIICVKGNCEAEVDQLMLEFPVLCEFGILELDGRRIYLTHGHRYNIDNPPLMSEDDVLIYGHTHVPLDQIIDGKHFLNPGSVSIPKENSEHGFILYENGIFSHHSL